MEAQENKIYSNIFYFKKIMPLGGTEQFLYEVAKKYKEYDILVLYDFCDPKQYERLSKFVQCKQRKPGEKIYCKKVFFNFNIDAIDDVVSTENYYAFVAHANFEELGYKPPIDNPKLNHFIAVSEFAKAKLIEYGERLGRRITVERCYNPLSLEPQPKMRRLVIACRLSDVVKGGYRTQKLIQKMDEYCATHRAFYEMLIFTGENTPVIVSPNVKFMKPTLDVRRYIADADIVLQLSNDMETYCYTLNEAWSYGTHTISTPQSVLKELPIPPEANYILDWDCSNIDDVVRHIFEDELKPFTYIAPNDSWDKILVLNESQYYKDLHTFCIVEATDEYMDNNIKDKELGFKPQKGFRWKTTLHRAKYMAGDNEKQLKMVKIIETIYDEDLDGIDEDSM